jgi:hypothetical protein
MPTGLDQETLNQILGTLREFARREFPSQATGDGFHKWWPPWRASKAISNPLRFHVRT